MTQPGGVPAGTGSASTSGPAHQNTGEPGVLSGPARSCALVSAGLAVAIYLLGFADNLALATLAWALVLGGGLLAGAAALPRSGRLLVPATVASVLGTLLLLQDVLNTPAAQTVLVVATVLAFVVAAVAAVGTLFATGLVAPPQARPRGYPAPGYGYPSGYGYGYGQQPGPVAQAPYGAGHGQVNPYAPPQQHTYSPADPTVTYQGPYAAYGQPPAGAPAAAGPTPPAPPAPGAFARASTTGPSAIPTQGGGTPTASAPTAAPGDWFSRPTAPAAEGDVAVSSSADTPADGIAMVGRAEGTGAGQASSGPTGTPEDTAGRHTSEARGGDGRTGEDSGEPTQFIAPSERSSSPAGPTHPA